jgi:hypothetical protein
MSEFGAHAAIEVVARNSYGRLIAYIVARPRVKWPVRKTRSATPIVHDQSLDE